MAVLGLYCCADFSLVAESGACSLAAARSFGCDGFPVAELGLEGSRASLVAVHGLIGFGSQALEHRLSRCGVWA